MRFAYLALQATLSLPSAVSFLSSCCSHRAFGALSRSATLLRMSDGDDWYADYDPKAYDRFNKGPDLDRGPRYDGGRHDYSRDTTRDGSNVDETAVNALLAERLAAKKRRDFDTADDIRDQLLAEFAVGINDRERTWRTGVSAGGSGMKYGGGGGGGRRKPDRDFGPNGHDYELSEDAGANTSSLSDDDIHAMIAERLQAKLNRNFDTADRIQYELVDAGVFVHDGMKEWRADGVSFGDLPGKGGQPGRTAGSRNDRNRPYTKSAHSLELSEAPEEEIEALIEERSKCKYDRDYLNADRIRDDLKELHNIYIDDRLREWSVGGDFGDEHKQIDRAMKSRAYVKSDTSPDLPSPADEEYVQQRIDERRKAKEDRDYDTADAIRDELRSEFNVVIDDKGRKWFVATPKSSGSYTRRGGGNLSEDDVATISSMIAERSQAKIDRNFDVCDDIRAHLRDTYNVTIDDRSREWRVDTDEYVQSPVAPGDRVLTAEEITIVQAKIEERVAFKRNKDYDSADAIRDELAESYSVLIDDRTKEWKTVEDGSTSDKFAANAMMSQTSAFKRNQIDTELEKEFASIFESNKEIDATFSSAESEEQYDENGLKEESMDSTENAAELSSLTVVQLKEKLREAGMPVSGNKSELIERLLS